MRSALAREQAGLQEREPHALRFYGRSGKLLRVTIHSCASDVLACECLQAALHTLAAVIGAGIAYACLKE